MFSSPLFLVLFVLIIPLLWRSKAHRNLPVRFVSSLTFWAPQQDEGHESARPRLLGQETLWDIAVLILLVLAASQLTFAARRPMSVVVDDSKSMSLHTPNVATRAEVAKAYARAVLRSNHGSTNGSLFFASMPESPALQGSSTCVSDLLKGWTPKTAPASEPRAILAASHRLEQADPNGGELVYVGDEAFNHWPTLPSNISVRTVNTPECVSNYAVLDVEASRSSSPDEISIFGRVGWVGVGRESTLHWTLSVDGVVALRGESLAKNGEPVPVRAVLARSGATLISLSVDDDDVLTDDNVLSTTVEYTPPVSISVRALDAGQRAALAKVPGMAVSEDNSDVQFTNNDDGHLVNAVIIPITRQRSASPQLEDFWQQSHPLLAGIDLRGIGIDTALSTTPEDTVLAGYKGNALVSINPRRRVVHLGFDPFRAGLVSRPEFPLLISNSVDWILGTAAHTPDVESRLVLQDSIRRPLLEHSGPPVSPPFIHLPVWGWLGLGALLLLVLRQRVSP